MTEKRAIITISGDLGSGKSTLRRLLGKALGFDEFSAGEMQREMAAERGMTSLQFNEHCEEHPEMDDHIDTVVRQIAEGRAAMVIDARLAWHFVPGSFKVHLTVHPLEGAKRVHRSDRGAAEGYRDISDARQGIRKRRASEDARYVTQYGVDTTDLRNYDLVIDTTIAQPDITSGLVARAFGSWLEDQSFPHLWVAPTMAYPTEDIRVLRRERVAPLIAGIRRDGFRDDEPVALLRVEEAYLILDGHARTAGAVAAQVPLMPGLLAAWDDHLVLSGGATAREYALASCTLTRIHDWEDANGFQFRHYPSFVL